MRHYACFFIAVELLFLSCTTKSFGKTTFSNITTDQSALLAFKNTIIYDPHRILLGNWSINTTICHWIGVSCGIKHIRVTALNVSGFGLVGIIPPHLGNLTFLRSLDISSNNFTGFIPSELSKLRRLVKINMGDNDFTGELPSWIGALSELWHVYLNNNTFSGRIPPSLFNISKLLTLDMSHNFLDGNVGEEIGNLVSLETLNLEGNELDGSIPNSIFNISSLMTIILRVNRLSGKLPNDICSDSSKLKSVSISSNKLFGEIPPSIGKCRDLEDLRLALNHLSGNIPSEIGNLTRLTNLSIFSNNFKGELPQELVNLRVVEVFSVGTNSFSGHLPSFIFNISTLKELRLSFNKFSGNLPPTFSLPNINVDLHLHQNRLIGSIPSSITNASKLTHLSLNNNSFSGSVPDFSNLRLLQVLRIWGNDLSGAEPYTQELGFLTSLTNCRYLRILQMSFNPLNGILPASVGNFSSSLVWFAGSYCNIKGVIPSEIGNLSSLTDIYLDGNRITGLIPTTIGKLGKLQRLSLDGNQLQGHIPENLCRMSYLGDLYLNSNMIMGPIPKCLGEVKSLRIINLGSNKLSSSIPTNIWNLRDLVVLNLSSNYLSGLLSSNIGNLKAINQLDLSSNRFLGQIPSSIDGCQSLEFLYLSNNMIGGSIPQSLQGVKGLITLDLSNNSLSGLIPKSLEELKFLEYFNVSYNSLEGEIPNGGCFVNFTAQSFVHNSALCGATRFQVPPCVRNHGGSRSKGITRLMKFVVPPSIFAVVVAIAILIILRWRRKHSKIPTDQVDDAVSAVGIAWKIISYNQLLQGTDSFSEENLLGRGSFSLVFKGKLLPEGLNIAVKVFNSQLQGGIKSFATETKILSNIRHRNLVRVLGCCVNSEFKALILEYMQNGSLEKWLYSDIYWLDLAQRLDIAIDVALALEYLHQGHTFPVVHCDIKPSNVLLDEDMVARVCDFGISKLFDEGEAMVQTRTLATIGYAAPEYGSEGIVSTSGDVYSYGVVLMEMFASKKPTDDMFSGETSLKGWVSEALEADAIGEVVAPGLLSREDQHFVAKEQCVTSIFDLAMKCLPILPNERINMIEAAATLQKIKATVGAANIKHFPNSNSIHHQFKCRKK
ncbi:hypothetical protein C2S53_001668 [Perilla frutescens var. hirtella]|uniref:non-specific serine/threonine protein kinase n=1 Tax=Perilla frutescens var. hirtella TaxID=608512 RepID=A0AAD4J321_PERFH|nr:hypothetical protein C2S53_001668 [Perilla frutescens var. hirtella]